MSNEDHLYGSITTRMRFDQLKYINENSGRHKKFKDKSVCVRDMFDLGCKVQALLDLKANPDKWDEFQTKLNEILSFQQIEQTMNKMDMSELDGIVAIAKALKNKKIEQLVLDFRSPET